MSKETISAQELGERFKRVSFTGEWVCNQYRFLLGRILTIVDASVVDPKQNKAMKDLIKGEVIEKLSFVSDVLSDGKAVEAPPDFNPSESGFISEDEALGLK